MDVKDSEMLEQYSGQEKYSFYDVVRAIFGILFEVFFFWQTKLYNWWWAKPRKARLIEALSRAETYEQWQSIAGQLDASEGNDIWYELGHMSVEQH